MGNNVYLQHCVIPPSSSIFQVPYKTIKTLDTYDFISSSDKLTPCFLCCSFLGAPRFSTNHHAGKKTCQETIKLLCLGNGQESYLIHYVSLSSSFCLISLPCVTVISRIRRGVHTNSGPHMSLYLQIASACRLPVFPG